MTLAMVARRAGVSSQTVSNAGVWPPNAHGAAAVDLVKYLTSGTQMLKNAATFGEMPSRTSAQAEHAKKNPAVRAWVDATAYAQGPRTIAGLKKILADLQRNGEQSLTKGD